MDFHRRNGVSGIKPSIYRHARRKYFDRLNVLFLRIYKKIPDRLFRDFNIA